MSEKTYKVLLHEPFRLKLAEILLPVLQKTDSTATLEQTYKALVEPPNPDMGHLAFGCFICAKALKKSPAQVALELKGQLLDIEGVSSVEAAGPYLNFKFTPVAFRILRVLSIISGPIPSPKATVIICVINKFMLY